VNDKPGVLRNMQKDAAQESRQPPDQQRQYSAVVPERELASMRQGMMPSPQHTAQFMDHQRAKMQPPFGHAKPMISLGSSDQPLRKLEEMAVNKETGSRGTHIMSPDHPHGDHARQQPAGNNKATAPSSSPADQEISFPFMLGKNGQHQASKDTLRDAENMQDRPNASPHESNAVPRKPMSKFAGSPEHVNSNNQSLPTEARNTNGSINGSSLLGNTNGSAQSGEDSADKQRNENSTRPGMSQNYMMGSPGSYSNHTHNPAVRLNPHKDRTVQEGLDKDETPSSRSTSMITYLKELSSRNPMDPMSIQSNKPPSEQPMLNSSPGAGDPSKSRESTRIGPPPPLQMHSGDLHLGLSYPSSISGGHQMSSSLQSQRANSKDEEHGRSFGSMYLDLDQRQGGNQSLMNLDKSVPYHHPQSMYSPHEALRRQQMFMMQRQMQAQDMGSYMSSQMSSATPGRLPMDLGIMQQQPYLNYGRHLGRNGEFPGPFSAHDMSAKPRFS